MLSVVTSINSPWTVSVRVIICVSESVNISDCVSVPVVRKLRQVNAKVSDSTNAVVNDSVNGSVSVSSLTVMTSIKPPWAVGINASDTVSVNDSVSVIGGVGMVLTSTVQSWTLSTLPSWTILPHFAGLKP